MEGVKVLAFTILASFSDAGNMCVNANVQDVKQTSNVLAILLSVDNVKSTTKEVVKK